ncbi:MAG: 2-C-methyl-D-erythritol 4-phosphate cytidylyltransferase [Desulfobacteraceae bacterium]|nr:2-C-methyl-D-erythritol 4-phosphate cytidylyltransferase [Desulfobacteraceae bacterium]
MPDTEIFAVIVAGGKGLRMESAVRKQYLDLAGLPVLVHTLNRFHGYPGISAIVLVVPEQDLGFCRDEILIPHGLDQAVLLVQGGAERQESVRNGLSLVADLARFPETSLVLIHDGVRAFVDTPMIQSCVQAAQKYGAAIPVVPVKDTLVKSDSEGFTGGNVDRNALFQVQTPQCFDLDLVVRAHDHARETGFFGTDDASLVTHLGHKVFMAQGSAKNIKITTQDDLVLANAMAGL